MIYFDLLYKLYRISDDLLIQRNKKVSAAPQPFYSSELVNCLKSYTIYIINKKKTIYFYFKLILFIHSGQAYCLLFGWSHEAMFLPDVQWPIVWSANESTLWDHLHFTANFT